MKLLRYHRGEDIIIISEEIKGILHIEVKPNTVSAFPIFFNLSKESILELRTYLNEIKL